MLPWYNVPTMIDCCLLEHFLEVPAVVPNTLQQICLPIYLCIKVIFYFYFRLSETRSESGSKKETTLWSFALKSWNAHEKKKKNIYLYINYIPTYLKNPWSRIFWKCSKNQWRNPKTTLRACCTVILYILDT